MSSTTRAQRGNNKGAQQNNPSTKHNKNTDKHAGDTPKIQDKIQAKPTAEQMRIAQITDVHFESPGIREMVTTIIEMTCRSEEEVCSALHDCDNDMDRAVNMLFESNSQSGWETSVKKKKSRVGGTGGGGTGGEGEEWDASAGNGGHIEPPRARSRGGSGAPRGGRRGNLDSRGWRGREQRENERNLEEGGGGGYRGDGGYRRGGGRSLNGPGGRGGGYGGRGGRGGGRLGGPRNYQPRGEFQSRGPRHTETSESWDEPQTNTYNNHNQTDNWGEKFPSPEDWDNEEYTGSLADTKVFTPSGNVEPTQGTVSSSEQSVQDTSMQEQNDIIQQYTATVVSSTTLPNLAEVGRADQSLSPSQLHPDTTSNIPGFTSPKNPAVITPSSNLSITTQGSLQNTSGVTSSPLSQPPPLPEVHSAPTAAQQLTQALEVHASVAGTQSSSSLSAEQSQYFSTLSQQNSDLKNSAYGSHPIVQPVSAGSPYSNSVSTPYNTQGYGNGTNYVVTGREPVVSAAPQPQRKQRARVPPPSKIPASAVEMPGDVSSSIGFLDVQFGALEFGSDTSSFDGNTTEPKYEAPSTPQPPIDIVQPLETYKSSTTINTSLGQSQMLSSTDTLTQPNNEHNLNSVSVQSYSSQSRSASAAPPAVVSVTNTPSTTNATLEQLTKSDSHTGYGSASANTVSQYQQNNYSKSQSAYQTPVAYSNNYSNTQVTTSYPQQSTVNSYSNSSGYNSSNVSAVYQPNSSNYSSQSVQSVSGYPTHSQGFSSITQPAAFPTQSQGAYQTTNTNQSVYGAGSGGLNTNYPGSNSANSVTGSQYNNYTASVATTHSHKLPNKEPQYDSPVSTTVSLSTTASSVNSPALGLTTQPSATVTKTTNSSVSANKNAVSTTGTANSGGMTGVAPVMGQYIMGQPYYQHPLYSYEELQLLQQRIPHMTTGYYDMGYQTTPTTLGTGRDAALGSVAYSMSDGRFTRADNNASPVPSTMSQQTGSGAGHAGAPMLNHTLPPGYAYFYGGGAMMPGSFQYGTPAIYPQMPTTANAHGSTNTSQYPKPSYSGYGSGYDSLSQSQDYSKPGGYPGAVSGSVGGAQGGPQTGNKGGTGATTQGAGPGGANSDLSSAMYGKSHAALNKVNSYEKQGFHSGTPPPFNLTGTGNSGLAPSGTYGTPHLFIPTMAAPQHQHHNTQLLHQPLHQMDGRSHVINRRDSGNSSGQRSQASSQPKTGTKQGYSPSAYWTPN